MNDIALGILIVISIIAAIILYKVLKPYFLKYDTTLCICGGLGAGKTLTAVKTSRVLILRQRLTKYYIYNFFLKIKNKILTWINKKNRKYNLTNSNKTNFKARKIHAIKPLRKKPMLYSNIPIHIKKGHLWWTKYEWSKPITAAHLACFKNIEEFSVVVIDEFPQFINQFNWDEELIQKNVNEWITFFRHYYNGYLLVTAQSVDEIVVQVRRKLNQAVWCFDFKKWLFGLFYTQRMCDIMLSDQVGTMSTTFIEENTKLHFGLFPPKGTYDTRCFSERTKNVYDKEIAKERWQKIKTNKIIRLQQYTSPLDDATTEEQKKQQYEKGQKIWKN